MCIERLDDIVLFPGSLGVAAGRDWYSAASGLEGGVIGLEPDDLGRKPSLSDLIHSPACLHELSCKLRLLVFLGIPIWQSSSFRNRETACCTQGDGARQERNEVIHLWRQATASSAWQLCNKVKFQMFCGGNHVLLHTS